MKTKENIKTKKEALTAQKNMAYLGLFNSIDHNKEGIIQPYQFWNELKSHGILMDDPRLKDINDNFKKEKLKNRKGITFELFSKNIC